MRLIKPVHLLAAGDFGAEPGLRSRRRIRPATDETWVRPFRFDAVPSDSDVLFAAAALRPGSQRPRRGVVMFRFVAQRFEPFGCAMLSPRYCAIDLAPNRTYLEQVLGVDYASYFPCQYDATIEIAGTAFVARGEIANPA